jgi:CheY-like chemotaxis protein
MTPIVRRRRQSDGTIGVGGARDTGGPAVVDVVVVDDDPAIRALLTAVLRAGGHDVRAADGAEQAVRMIREQVPAVVIVDAVMPDLDGFTLCREIRGWDLPAQPRMVLLTGLDEVPPGEDGFDRVLTKVISPYQVLACVAELAAGR